MHLQAIINTAADKADEILRDVTTPGEARTVIAEWLGDSYPQLNGDERRKVIQDVLALLDREGFFETAAGGEPWAESDAASSE